MSKKYLAKREVDLVIISDVHLGAFGCRAKELLIYLRSTRPKMLVLNGDIVDIWQFRKRYFPKSHLLVIRYLTGLIAKNTKVVYITGNHDELLRKFVKFNIGSFKLVNKLLLELDGKKIWIFHGDVFDITMQYSKWLAKLGSIGYDMLIMLNSTINFLLTRIGREKISFSKRIKNSVKTAVSYINKFEETAAAIAISKGYTHVICGHIHQPAIRRISNTNGDVIYLNSGDWIENLSALEYNKGEWSIYNYREDLFAQAYRASAKQFDSPSHKETFEELLKEFSL
ncbi:MAG: UDP-2,3-diacylglucosamine diphosphatase [Bacteroidales bacterium]|jgi:UDP-2,3-diacylglucosamine pyrophosphatase LpxH|nr:UDP-2,3-diacylglucosamine diphosphatase [Bacteroidales bacterium]